MEIGSKIKSARKTAGMTQEYLAEELGSTRQTISNWENNRSYPDIISIVKMSDIFGISLDEFLKGDEKILCHLEKNTNTVKSRSKIIKLLEIVAFYVVWCLCVIVFIMERYSNSAEPLYTIMYFILPITIFVISIIIGLDSSWGKFKFNIPFLFGLMYVLLVITFYITRGYDTLKIIQLIYRDSVTIIFVGGIVISYIALLIGYLIKRYKSSFDIGYRKASDK